MKTTGKSFGRKPCAWIVAAALVVALFATSGVVLAEGDLPDLRDKTETIRDNHAAMLGLRGDIAQTRLKIREQVRQLRDSGGTIDEETRDAVRAAGEALKAAVAALRDTVGDIAGETAGLRTDRANRDWAAVEGHLDAIIAIQETRLEQLSEILGQVEILLRLLG